MKPKPEIQIRVNREEVARRPKNLPAFISFVLSLGLTLALFFAAGVGPLAAEESPVSRTPMTSANPDLSPELLHLAIRHMTGEELFAEADAWLDLLKQAAKRVYTVKYAIEEKNAAIDALTAQETNPTSAMGKESIQRELAAAEQQKAALLEQLTKLRGEREGVVDRLDTVLNNINDKIGTDEDGTEKEKVLPYRRYINTVSGIAVNVTDTQSAWKGIAGWFKSDEGGLRWLINIAQFIAVLIGAWILSKMLRTAVKGAFKVSKSKSKLLSDFIANIVEKTVLFVGFLVGLAALGVSVGPIVAVVGAAGFIIAFALQSTLSNFASGLMLMLYRPYDIGDVVDVSGVSGTVKEMTLVSTTIMTGDNRLMVVPNNSIWGNIITNVTHSDIRRVDLTFGIGYDDEIDHAQTVMKEILSEHPLVLKDPEAIIRVDELADSSVNIVCRPWVKTPDYWTVRSEITRTVKERFDKEGISIPYPKTDIHIFRKNALTEQPNGSPAIAS